MPYKCPYLIKYSLYIDVLKYTAFIFFCKVVRNVLINLNEHSADFEFFSEMLTCLRISMLCLHKATQIGALFTESLNTVTKHFQHFLLYN